MFKLITSCSKNGAISPLINFPREVIQDHEKKLLDWFISYHSKYGRVPPVGRIKKEFHFFIEVPDPENLPPMDLRDLTIRKKRTDYFLALSSEIQAESLDNGDVPLQRLHEMMSTLVKSNNEFQYYTTFDRKKAFGSAPSKLLNYGVEILDKVTGGLVDGDFHVIAGRLGTGKTTLNTIFSYGWFKQKKRVLYISQELLPAQIISKIDSLAAGVNPTSFRSRELKSDMLNGITAYAGLGDGEIIIPSVNLKNVGEIYTLARSLDIDVIVIDGFYLLNPSSKMFRSKYERISEVSNELKSMAIDLKIPILGITQIKRGVNEENFTSEDLAFSDDIGRDSDVIIAIRQEKNKDAPSSVTFFMQVVKNRHGINESDGFEIGVSVDFDTMTVRDLSTGRSVI